MWGGPGDDTMISQTTNGGTLLTKVLHGGSGDDLMYGGGNATGGPGTDTTNGIWMYGDEGDDVMYGKDNAVKRLMWGGSGDDYMRGGDGATTSKIDGGDDAD